MKERSKEAPGSPRSLEVGLKTIASVPPPPRGLCVRVSKVKYVLISRDELEKKIQ